MKELWLIWLNNGTFDLFNSLRLRWFNRNSLKLTNRLCWITFRYEIVTIGLISFICCFGEFTISLSKRSLLLINFTQEIITHRCWRCQTWRTRLHFKLFPAVDKLTRTVFDNNPVCLCKLLLIHLGRPKSICIDILFHVVLSFNLIGVWILLEMKWCWLSRLNITIAKFLGLSHLSWFCGHGLELFVDAELIIGPIFTRMCQDSLRAVTLLKVVTVIAVLSCIPTLLNEIGQFDLSLWLGVIQSPLLKVVVY